MRMQTAGCLALCLLLSAGTASADAARTTVTVLPEPAACETARLGDATARPGEDGGFVFSPALDAPTELRFECGRAYAFHVAPGDDLVVRLQGDEIVFEGRGADANRYLAAPAALSAERLMEGIRTPWARFAPAWADARAEDLARLAAIAGDVGADFAARERARIDYRWARGQVLFPYLHWRETDTPGLVPAGEPAARLGEIPVEAPQWSELPEYRDFLAAYLHETARVRMAGDDALRAGDVRWLRAELAAARELASPALRLAQATRLVETHVADNGAAGIDAVWPAYLALSPPAEARGRIEAAIAEDRAKREGHRIDTYRTVDGVALELHVLPPTAGGGDGTATPAMLWLHGGSGTDGTWWHCPILCEALRANGVAVLAVELRTGSRFDSGPLEALDDAGVAWRWSREHAAELSVDADRIGVAGFSSGATLALLLATRGVDAGDDDPRHPAAVIAMGGCADPIGPEEDGWFRRRVAERGAPADYSPIERVGAGQPPLLAVHAGADEYCSHARMEAFVARYRAAGNDATLETVPEVGHFFPFYYPPGVQQTREAVAGALGAWGWKREP